MFSKFFKSRADKQEKEGIEQRKYNLEKAKLLEKPKGHDVYKDEDIDNCPYFQIQQKIEQEEKNEKNSNQQIQEKKKKKEKLPKGGCPFLVSEKKKNPPLASYTEAYGTEFISPVSYLFDYKGFSSISLQGKNNKQQNRKVFEGYPIYLKHTLLHNEDQMMLKVRKCEINQRFFAYDQLREKGNKAYFKENYYEALEYYERAFSCFRWLELKEEEDSEDDSNKKKKNESEKKVEECKSAQNNQASNKQIETQSYQNGTLIQDKIQPSTSNTTDNNADTNKSNENINNDKSNNENNINETKKEEENKENKNEGNEAGSTGAINGDTDNEDNQSQSSQNSYDDDKKKEEEEKSNQNGKQLEVEKHLIQKKWNDESQIRQVNQDKSKKKQPANEEEENAEETAINMDKNENSKNEVEDEKNDEEIKKMKKEEKEFKKKYRTLLTTYNDDNVILKDGEEITCDHDKDLRNSMLMTLLMNLTATYMKLKHFKQAAITIQDAFKIYDKSSQLYLKKSQSIAYNLFSTLQELQNAKKDIELALEMKHHEKIFQQEPGILKILNLQNHNEVYKEQGEYVVKRINERKTWEISIIKEILEREKEIEEIVAEMIENGNPPVDDEQNQEGGINIVIKDKFEEEMERIVLKIMIDKFYGMVEFYKESRKMESVNYALEEIQKLNKILNEMEYCYNLDFTKPELNELIAEANNQFNVDFTNGKVQKRLIRIKSEKAKKIYEESQFNLEMFEYALKEYFKIKNERDEKLKQQQEKIKQQQQQLKDKMSTGIIRQFFKNSSPLELLLQFLFLGLVAGFLYYMLNSDNNFIYNLFLDKKE